ncbi:hypothetical protein R0137_17030 [Congregibacter brevis]|uniref:Glycosyltransferase RgtA/B/C/D-like domain-containing protein n=1 Tax=Congregibacter brevis TaxID=3081201 RepID=A0ABZ0IBM7_9GAMM|nr:hypothetical protein R0137_17030 [Congregibacter sp. IMCC45268]
MIFSLALATAILTPIIVGSSIVAAMAGSSKHWATVLGQGFLFGFCLCALLLLLGTVALGNFNTPLVYGVMLVLGALSTYVVLRRQQRRFSDANTPSATFVGSQEGSLGTWILCALFVGLSIVHITLASIDAALRPVFPWDAWNSWFPMTLQYYQADTLSAPVDTMKGQAHLPTINLIEIWILKATGPASLAFQILWPAALTALWLVVFGFMRESCCSLALSAFAAYVVVSMPLVSTHAALAGYAGLWLSLATTIAFFEVSRLLASGSGRWSAFLAVVVAMVLKTSGIVVAFSCFAAFLIFYPWNARSISTRKLAGGAAVIVGLAVVSVLVDISYITAITSRLSRDAAWLGTANFNQVSLALSAIANSVFISINWGIAPAIVVAAIAWGIGREKHPASSIILAQSLIYLSVSAFYFAVVVTPTGINQTGFSRAAIAAFPALLAAGLLQFNRPAKQL